MLVALRRLGRLLQRRADRRLGAARLPAARCTCWGACCGSGLRRPRPGAERGALPLLVPALVAGDRARLPRRLPHRAQRHGLQRHRRRLLGRDRRRPARRRRPAVRHLPRRQPARRHLRPGDLRRLRARSSSCCRGAGAGTTCRRRTPPRSPSTCSAWRCCSSSAGACGGRRSASCSPTPGRPTRSRSTSLNTNANDALVGALVLARAARRRVGAGARAARSSRSAGLTKFAPLALGAAVRDARRETGDRLASAPSPLGVRGRRVALAWALVARLAAATCGRSSTARSASRPIARLAVLDLGPAATAHERCSTSCRRRGRCSRVAVAFVPRRRDLVGLAALRRGGADRPRSSA